MNRFLRYVVISLSLALLPACAQLPEYAQPRMVQTDELQKTLATGFPYRPLTPDDFRAASLSEQQAEHAERINAHTARKCKSDPLEKTGTLSLYLQSAIENLGAKELYHDYLVG